tara:strand:+ start:46 stop:309 length:264 start_codon:yes stop_codon:yes gene_type:complete
MIIFLFLEISKPLGAQEEKEKNITKDSIINRICIARLKSEVDIKNKQNFNEISHFTCECFYRKYKSGTSLKGSRIYCKNKASEKYNL